MPQCTTELAITLLQQTLPPGMAKCPIYHCACTVTGGCRQIDRCQRDLTDVNGSTHGAVGNTYVRINGPNLLLTHESDFAQRDLLDVLLIAEPHLIRSKLQQCLKRSSDMVWFNLAAVLQAEDLPGPRVLARRKGHPTLRSVLYQQSPAQDALLCTD